LGSHLCDRFVAEGYSVIGMDNLITGDLKNIEHLFKLKNFEFYHHDVTKFVHVPGHLDYILHFASPASPIDYLKIPIQTLKVGSLGTHNLLGLARVKKARILIASTSEIYGHRDEKTYLKENDPKILVGDFTVRNEYAIAKLLSEIAIVNTGKIDDDFKYQIIRPFNVTGKYQLPDGGFVIPRFMDQAINDQDITVYYDGLQLRAFTWVKDIVDGVYLTSVAPEDNWNQEWNIGNEKNEETILYLAEKVKEISGSKSNIINIDPVKLHGKLSNLIILLILQYKYSNPKGRLSKEEISFSLQFKISKFSGRLSKEETLF
jgi:dTDP-glucose 4,6-dehydratase